MRVLAIDFGERRVGLALSDESQTLARPWKTIEVRGGSKEALVRVAAEIEELINRGDAVERIIVGLPLSLDGRPNDRTAAARRFADRLAARMSLTVTLQDERLTSREAESRLALTERAWRRRKVKLDAAAAAVILQEYLDRAAAARGSTGSLEEPATSEELHRVEGPARGAASRRVEEE